MEQWKTHPVFVDYEVSDEGGVRRFTPCMGTRKGRVKKPTPTATGYLVVMIGKKPKKVHTLVLEAFKGPRPPGHDGCHLDGDRTNNRLTNLEWATRAMNMAHARAHGTDARCDRHGGAKLTALEVAMIRKMKSEGFLHREIGPEFGVSPAHVSYIVNHGWRL